MSRSFRSLFGSAALIFAVLFTTVGVGQYWFLRWQLSQETKNDLWDLAEYTRDQIAFADTWNLQGYRRASEGPDIFLVMAQNGTLIDTHGYLRGMVSQVSLPFTFEYDHPVRFLSDVGEDWNFYVHKLRDGIVVLGARKETTPEGINGLFASNAARFGTSVVEALRTRDRAIHEAFDYAIIDKNGVLLWAIGGIPLKASSPAIPATPTLVPIRQIGDKMYAAFLDPVVSKSGSEVGLISVFEDVTDEQHVLRRSAIFNLIVAAILWVITVGFSAAYLRRVRPSAISCAQIPFLDEDETVEFKSSLRWDYAKQKPSKEVERAIVKTVAGFLNSENGGTPIIGISDSKAVLGLQADYASFKSVKPDRDGFEQTLRQILIVAVGERRCARSVKARFCSSQGKELCIVTVAPSSEPVFLEDEAGGQLYVRVGNSTRPFGVQEALAYARDRWGGLALLRSHMTS
jgi:Putative DNA-binding domain